MEREKINLTEEELEDFDFTGGYKGTTWELRDEIYDYVKTIRTDQYSDGESWDIVVKRQNDGKFFKWNCWEGGRNGYQMSSGDNYMKEVFPKTITKIIYE